jgi:hypothetical protein
MKIPIPIMMLSRNHLRLVIPTIGFLLLFYFALAEAGEPLRTMENKMPQDDVDNSAAVSKFDDLRRQMTRSKYVVRNGELACRAGDESANPQVAELEIVRNFAEIGLHAAQAKLPIPDGAAVIIIEMPENYEVIIGSPPPAGKRGADYTAKVVVDKKTRTVVRVLAGS